MPTRAPADSPQLQTKAKVVDDIKARLDRSDAAILTEYRGLSVTDLAALRAELRPSGARYTVYKNSLARRAVEEAGLDGLIPMLEGPVAIAFVEGDAVPAAKALRQYSRANPTLVVKGGLLGGRVLSSGEVEALADIAPREVLLARLAGGFQAPLVKAAGLFQAITRNMAYGVKAYLDLRVEAGEALPPEAAPETAEAAEAPETAEAATAPEVAEAAEPGEPGEQDRPEPHTGEPAT